MNERKKCCKCGYGFYFPGGINTGERRGEFLLPDGQSMCETCMADQQHPPTNMNDPVNPDHYKAGGVEVIDILKAKLTKDQFDGFLMGNVIKYTLRAGMKNGAEDLKKAAWYSSMLAGVDPRKETITLEEHAASIDRVTKVMEMCRPIEIKNPLEGAEIRYLDAAGICIHRRRWTNGQWDNQPTA